MKILQRREVLDEVQISFKSFVYTFLLECIACLLLAIIFIPLFSYVMLSFWSDVQSKFDISITKK